MFYRVPGTGNRTPSNKYELENRLVKFGVMIIELTKHLDGTYTSKHLSSQIIPSGTSPALNYAEAQDAESTKDFIHKLKIVLKELRETLVALKMIDQASLCTNQGLMRSALQESNELVSIFVVTLRTAKSNQK